MFKIRFKSNKQEKVLQTNSLFINSEGKVFEYFEGKMIPRNDISFYPFIEDKKQDPYKW